MARSLLVSFFAFSSLSERVSAEESTGGSITQVFTDSLLPGKLRPVGAAIGGTALAEGEARWASGKGVAIGERGATAASPGGAHHSIKPVAGTIRLQADVSAQGSGFTGVALGKGDLSGNFWVNLAMVFYVSESRYDLTVGSQSLISKANKALLRADGPNHLELLVDTISRTVTARLNGTLVLDAVSLPTTVPWSGITAAGFRFNDPITAGAPSVSNYRAEVVSKASSGFELVDLDMSMVVPDQPATLRWRVNRMGPTSKLPYLLTDYTGRKIGSGEARLSSDQTVTITRAFPRGYGEITFPEANQTFGLVALEPPARPYDPFFCLDAGLSWLELNPDRRAALVKIAARCGIAMSRERLGLGSVNPEKGKFDWESRRLFGSLRKMYADSKVPILEILEGGGKYLGSTKGSMFPANLPEMAAAWTEVARHWQVWGGAEVCNEQDLKPIPAEQYVPMAKSMSYALTKAPSKVPLVSGVFATIPPGPYFDTCAANGMLEDSNAVSFHSYDRAPDVESMVSRYRTWLKNSGKEAMPLWHTECGWAWTQGPDRPPQDQDAMSALEISTKAVESRACGVARYFPFVYVYYEEGQKAFGMMGREATPLRSMAAYAMCIHALSGKNYLGDLEGLDASIKMARVFGNSAGKEWVAVLYTGRLNPQAKVVFPITVKRAAGADGRELQVSDQSLPIPDGMTYVWMDSSDLRAKLKTDTAAKRLYELGQHPLEQKRRGSPLVLQFLAEQTPSRASARRYLITQETAHDFPLHVRIHNLSQAPIAFTPELSLPGKTGEKAASVTVPAMGYSDLAWKLDVTPNLDIAQTHFISVSGKAEKGIQPLPLAIPIVIEGTLEQHLKKHKKQTPLQITSLTNWRPNIAGNGKSTFVITSEGAWRTEVKFSGGGGNWTYPKFILPEKLAPDAYSGFLMRARILQAASNVAIIAGSGDKSPSFWVSDLFPADGEWHVVYVPFAEFKPGPGGAGNQNTRLDPASWKDLAIGMGSKGPENALEVSQFILVGGNGD
ncbi:MAG: hypothetical protein QOE70_39 [Chthoniobacter sp.]|jgi:hypothetical protein|nr:hypothetical protein [Chthoniobacter sp.]